ncbi:helix-turn-helix transcriptional regulator [Pseudonocardia alni]|uniref:helix-turn-helix transcriptional regulator n=1 Tax=Pseudonocardia alni TaxID=33907 RepID=UPI0033C6A4B2
MSESGDGTRLANRPRAEAVSAWNAAHVRSFFADSVWIPDGPATFSGTIRRRTVEDLIVIDIEADPFGRRFLPDSAASGFIGFSITRRPFRERILGLGDRSVVLSGADSEVWNPSRLIEAEVVTPMALTALLVPKPALSLERTSMCDVTELVRAGDAAALRILRGLVLALVEEPDLRPSTATAARNGVVELLTDIVREPRSPGTAAVSDAMRLSIHRWVQDHLADGQLAPAEAARHHGISVRSLHRLFDRTGETFGAFVRRARLQRAHRDLTTGDDLVQRIAVRWGYADASHFIHDFRIAYGMSPAAYRRTVAGRETVAR